MSQAQYQKLAESKETMLVSEVEVEFDSIAPSLPNEELFDEQDNIPVH